MVKYNGISHLHDDAERARFTTTPKNKFDVWCRQVYSVKFADHLTRTAYIIRRSLKIFKIATFKGGQVRPAVNKILRPPNKPLLDATVAQIYK